MFIAIISAVLIVIIDQISKWLIVSNMNLGDSTNIIPGLLNFTYSHNDGMALGIGSSAFRYVFIFITVIVCAVLVFLMFKPQFNNKLYFAATACVVGGGIGNLIDRIVNGYVVDFLALSFFPPICNIADYFITAGTVMLMIYIVFYYGKSSNKENNR